MAFIVGMFEARDDRLSSPNERGQLCLTPARLRSGIVDELRDMGIERSTLAQLSQISIASDHAIDDLHAIRCLSHFLVTLLDRYMSLSERA